MSKYLAWIEPVLSDAHPEHPIVIPPPIDLLPKPPDPPYPAHPIVIPPPFWPPDVHIEHPIVIPPTQPVYPAHPIVLPGVPTHPIVIPPVRPLYPSHPIVLPGYPAHPIVLPPPIDGGTPPDGGGDGKPPAGGAGTPTHPINLPPYPAPPGYVWLEIMIHGFGWVWVLVPIQGAQPPQTTAPPAPTQQKK